MYVAGLVSRLQLFRLINIKRIYVRFLAFDVSELKPVYRKNYGVWHKCPNFSEVHLYEGRVRHIRVRVEHFCSYGTSREPIILRDIKTPRSLLKPRSRQLRVFYKAPRDGKIKSKAIMCIVDTLKWVDHGNSEISGEVSAIGMVTAQAARKPV